MAAPSHRGASQNQQASSSAQASTTANDARQDRKGESQLHSSDPASVRGLRVPSPSKPSTSAESSASKKSAAESSVKTSPVGAKDGKASKVGVEPDHGLQLRRWFRQLKLEERRRVVSIMDEEMTELVLLMSLKLKKEGPGMFSEVGQTDDVSLFGALGSAPPEVARNRSNSLSHLPPYSASHSNTNARQGRSLFRTGHGASRRGATSVGVDAPGYASSSRSQSQTREPVLRFRQALSGASSAAPSRAPARTHSFSSASSSSSSTSSSSGPSTALRSSLGTSNTSNSTKPKSTSAATILDMIHRLGDDYSRPSSSKEPTKRKASPLTSPSRASSSNASCSHSPIASSSSSHVASSSSSGNLKSVESSSSAVNVRAGRSLFPVRYFDDFFASDLIALNPYTPDEENFLFRRHCSIINNDSFTSRTIQMEQELIDAIRLCDAKQYLDTITLSLELLSNTKKFFNVMRVSSRGEFLKKPCKMSWNARTKTWLVQAPLWFTSMGYYSFGTFLASQFEMKLWQAYYHYANIDPRRESGHFGSGASKASAKLTQNRHQDVLVSKSHLVDYWMQLSHIQKTALIRSMGNMIEARVKLDLSDLSYPQLLNFLLKLTSVSHNVSNADNPLLQPNNEREFIDFIFMSPLRRAGTGVDLVLRRLGVFIETAYVDQERADLILGEKMEKEKAKSKGRRNKKSKSSHPVAAPSDAHVHSPSKTTPEASSSRSDSASHIASSSNVATSSNSGSSQNTAVASSSGSHTLPSMTSTFTSSVAPLSNPLTPATSPSKQPTSTSSPNSSPAVVPSSIKPTTNNSPLMPTNSKSSTAPSPATMTESLLEAQLSGFTLVAGRRKGTFTRAKDDSAAPNQKKAPHIDHGKHRPRSKDDTHSGTWTGPPKRNLVITTTSGNGTVSSAASLSNKSAPANPSSTSSTSTSQVGGTTATNTPSHKLLKRAASNDMAPGRSSGNTWNTITSTGLTGTQSNTAAQPLVVASTTLGGHLASHQALPPMKPLSKSGSAQLDTVMAWETVPLSPSSSSSATTTSSTASTSTPHTNSSARRDPRTNLAMASIGGVANATTGPHAAIWPISGNSASILASNATSVSSGAGNSSSLKTSSESLPAPSQVPQVIDKLELQAPLRSRPTSSPPAPQLHMLNLPSTASSAVPSPSASSTALSTTSEIFSDPVGASSSWSAGWSAGVSTAAPVQYQAHHSPHASTSSQRRSLNSSASSASSTASSSDFSSSGYSGSTPTYSGATSTTSGGGGAYSSSWIPETMSDHPVTSRSTHFETLSDRPYPTQKTRTLPSLYRSSPAVQTQHNTKPFYSQSATVTHSLSSSSQYPSSLSLASSSSSASFTPNQQVSRSGSVGRPLELSSTPTATSHLDTALRASSHPDALTSPLKESKIANETNNMDLKSEEISSCDFASPSSEGHCETAAEKMHTATANRSSAAISRERPIATKSMSISAQPYFPPYPSTLSPPRSAQLHHGASMRQSTPPGRLQGMEAWHPSQLHIPSHMTQQLVYPSYATTSSAQPQQAWSASHVPLEFGPGSALHSAPQALTPTSEPPSPASLQSMVTGSTHEHFDGTPGSPSSLPATGSSSHLVTTELLSYLSGGGYHVGPMNPADASTQPRSTDDHGVVPSRHGKHRHELAPSDRTFGNWKQQKAKRAAAAASGNGGNRNLGGGASLTMPMPSYHVFVEDPSNGSNSGNSNNGQKRNNGPGSPSKGKHPNAALLAMPLDPMHPLAYTGMGMVPRNYGPSHQQANVHTHGTAAYLVPHPGSAPPNGAALPHVLFMRAPPVAPELYRVDLPKRSTAGCETLTNEILDFVRRVDAIVAPRTAIVLETVAQVQRVVEACFAGQPIEAEMYGSFSTNLGIPSSDVDLVVKRRLHQGDGDSVSSLTEAQPAAVPQSPREVALAPLTTLYKALTCETWVKPEKMQLIDTATVPVIKLVTQTADLPVDITMEDPSKPHTGLLTRALTQRFREQYPALRPLALVLKQMMHDCGLANIYTGGISSYFLVILLVSFLQLYGGNDQTSLGELLLNFLDLYGNHFNFATTQISILGEGAHTLLPPSAFHPHPSGPGNDGGISPPTIPPLNIVDPLNPNNTVGQSVFGMWQVQHAFKNAFNLLHAHFFDPSRDPSAPCHAVDALLATVLAPQPS